MITIKAIANKSKKTFTLRKYDKNNILYAKYRTAQMSKEEFEEAESNTSNDWKDYLSINDVIVIK
jgi:hypothetical protein